MKPLWETLDILESAPNIVRKLKAVENDIAKGEFTPWHPEKSSGKEERRPRSGLKKRG